LEIKNLIRKEYLDAALKIMGFLSEQSRLLTIQKWKQKFNNQLNEYLKNIVQIYLKRGINASSAQHWEDAEKYYQQVSNLLEKYPNNTLNSLVQQKLCNFYNSWANIHLIEGKELLKQNKFQIACDKLQLSLEIVEKANNRKVKKPYVDQMNKLYTRWAEEHKLNGLIALKRNAYADAIKSFSEGLSLVKKTNNSQLIQKYHTLLGKVPNP
jgi:tetratricopeptide (TPR) repeat protein